MKEFKERLIQLQDEQNRILKEYRTLVSEVEADENIRENEKLRRQYEEYRHRADALQEQLSHLDRENQELRRALSEQMLDEKLGMLSLSRHKVDTYFAGKGNTYGNRLSGLETMAKDRLDHLYDQAERQLAADKAVIQTRLKEFGTELDQRIAAHRQHWREEEQRIRQSARNGYDQLAEEGIDEETMERRKRQNRMEMKIGLNWINRIGILLIILCVGAAFRYTYLTWFNGYMKGLVFFLLGALMLAGGEWLHRKGKGAFALGLLGGGVSVLYGSVFYSYFLLEIISLSVGLVASVLITALAVLLSLRYQSRTICSLGLIGGYLPLFSYMGAFGLTGNAVYVAMGYLLLLNALILLVSFRQKWSIVSYISFLFHAPSMIALAWLADQAGIAILHVVLAFVMYIGITLWVPFRYGSKLTWWDFVLLTLNTLVSCGTLYGLIAKADWTEFRGLLALLFCIVFTLLGRFTQTRLPREMAARVLFYSTGLTFAMLMIPFQLDIRWVSLGWLLEALALSIFGNRSRQKAVERAGWGILLLCIVAFFWVDYIRHLFGAISTADFNMQYSYISLGVLLFTVFYAFRLRGEEEASRYLHSEHSGLSAIKYVALVNLWLYLLYEVGYIYERVVPGYTSHYDLYRMLLIAGVTMGMAYGLTKIPLLYDRFVKYYALSLHGLSLLLSFAITVGLPTLAEQSVHNGAAEYIALIVLIAFNIVAFFSGRDLLFTALNRNYQSTELYPLILGVYLLAVITAFLGVQFQLGDVGLAFSLVYLLLAVGYIVYGFSRRYVKIRWMGLGLTLFSTGKMLLYDLSLLTLGSKIIAYFCFGVLLLGISYMYQRVSNRLDERDRASDQEQPPAQLQEGQDVTE